MFRNKRGSGSGSGAGTVVNAAGISGNLMKRGRNNNKWKPRFFVLEKSTLKYYKKAKECEEATDLLGYTVVRNDALRQYAMVLTCPAVPKARPYFIAASSEEECTKWLAALQTAVAGNRERTNSRRKSHAPEDEKRDSRPSPDFFCRLTLLGPPKCGKTALTNRWVLDYFNQHDQPTLLEEREKRITIDGKVCQVEIVDASVAPQHREERQNANADSDGFLCCYSMVDFGGLQVMRRQINSMMEARSKLPPLVVVCTMCDEKSDKVADRVAAGRVYAESLGVPFFEASAKSESSEAKQGVSMAFEWVVRLVAADMRQPWPQPPYCIPPYLCTDTFESGPLITFGAPSPRGTPTVEKAALKELLGHICYTGNQLLGQQVYVSYLAFCTSRELFAAMSALHEEACQSVEAAERPSTVLPAMRVVNAVAQWLAAAPTALDGDSDTLAAVEALCRRPVCEDVAAVLPRVYRHLQLHRYRAKSEFFKPKKDGFISTLKNRRESLSWSESPATPTADQTNRVESNKEGRQGEEAAAGDLLTDVPTLAQAFAFAEAEMMMAVAVERLVHADVHSAVAALARRRFAKLSAWAQFEVCREFLLARRVETLSTLVDVAGALHTMGCFSAACALVSGLSADPVARLAKTWKGAGEARRDALSKLAVLYGGKGGGCSAVLREQILRTRGLCMPPLAVCLPAIDTTAPPVEARGTLITEEEEDVEKEKKEVGQAEKTTSPSSFLHGDGQVDVARLRSTADMLLFLKNCQQSVRCWEWWRVGELDNEATAMLGLVDGLEDMDGFFPEAGMPPRLILHATLEKHKGQGQPSQVRHYYLYEHMLLWTKPVGSKEQLCKAAFLPDISDVGPCAESEAPNAFKLTWNVEKKTYVLTAESDLERDAWVAAVCSAITDHKEKVAEKEDSKRLKELDNLSGDTPPPAKPAVTVAHVRQARAAAAARYGGLPELTMYGGISPTAAAPECGWEAAAAALSLICEPLASSAPGNGAAGGGPAQSPPVVQASRKSAGVVDVEWVAEVRRLASRARPPVSVDGVV